MKILYLTNNIDPRNGWGRLSSDLIQGVRGSGHDVTVLTEHGNDLGAMPILKRNLGMFASVLKVRSRLKSCDIMHAIDGYPQAIIGALAALGLNKKLVVTAVGTYSVAPLYNFGTGVLLEWAYGRAQKITAISYFTKKEILKKKKVEIEVINPGIDYKKFYRPHLESQDSFILSVGALKHRKGYHISIPAFALAKKQIPGLKYKIVCGRVSDDGLEYFKFLGQKHDVADSLEFLTEVNDRQLVDLYQKAKLFILTSVNEDQHFEGFGLVFLEAAAAGLPVIGTMGNGIEDAVKNGGNGLLVPQNDVEKTTQAITAILKSPEKWQVMSDTSYSWARDNNYDKTIKKYLDIYENVHKKNY